MYRTYILTITGPEEEGGGRCRRDRCFWCVWSLSIIVHYCGLISFHVERCWTHNNFHSWTSHFSLLFSLSLSDEAQKIMRIWSGIKVYAANHILYLFSLGAIFRLCVFVLDGDGVTELLIYPEKNSKLWTLKEEDHVDVKHDEHWQVVALLGKCWSFIDHLSIHQFTWILWVPEAT